MANEPIASSHRRAWPRSHRQDEATDGRQFVYLDDEIDWVRYWLLFRRWWLTVASVSLVAAATTGVSTKFYMQKWYQASAVLIPVSKPLGIAEGGGLMSAVGGSGLADLLGGSLEGESERNAQQYISILGSYAFTTTLAQRYPLVAAFAKDANDGEDPRTRWQLYQIISGHFGTDYSFKTGNLTLSFVAKTPEDARRILDLYVSDLRDKLRTREVHDASVAVASLREEVNKTSDSLLQNQLYELMASQLQRQKLAQMQADFAFTVIEPPVVPDRPFRPKVLLDCIAAAVAALFLTTAVILVHEFLLTIRSQLTDESIRDESIASPQSEPERLVVGRSPAVVRGRLD